MHEKCLIRADSIKYRKDACKQTHLCTTTHIGMQCPLI